MKKIVLFDTEQGSLNAGDFIINACINQEMAFLLDGQCIVRYSTHLPISRFYQTFRKNVIYKTCRGADYRFLCGTNLFKNSLLRISPDWNINFTSCEYYQGSIAIGCGMDMNSRHSDAYTRYIYKKILTKDYIHSVRDERTKQYLESLGVRAINTGCPTMWALTPEHCAAIPRDKKANVVFTLTDYKQDPRQDKLLIDVLRRNYEKISFWVQGFHDYDYLTSLTQVEDIEIIPHDLEAYTQVLQRPDVEYIGTRLHAGIYAMRQGVRSIILSVDNRAEDLGDCYNIPILSRTNVGERLEEMLRSSFQTSITIPRENIALWKSQFR